MFDFVDKIIKCVIIRYKYLIIKEKNVILNIVVSEYCLAVTRKKAMENGIREERYAI